MEDFVEPLATAEGLDVAFLDRKPVIADVGQIFPQARPQIVDDENLGNIAPREEAIYQVRAQESASARD
jgi:hypothetical protein